MKTEDEKHIIFYDSKRNKLITRDSDDYFQMLYDEEMNDIKVQTNSKQITDRDTIIKTVKQCIQRFTVRSDVQRCVTSQITHIYERLEKQTSRVKQQISSMSYKLRNSTCLDDNMSTISPIRSFDVIVDKTNHGFRVDVDQVTVTPTQFSTADADETKRINVLLNTSHANIWTIEEFITQEECDVLMKFGSPRLQRATVAAEDGSSVVNINRKAQQASYDTYTNPKDPLW